EVGVWSMGGCIFVWLKCKGSVIEENTIEDAINVEEYLSEDKNVSQDEGIKHIIGAKRVKSEKEGKIATKQKIDDIVDIVKDEEMIKNWEDQFGTKKFTPNVVKHMISNSNVANMNFKLNFIVLFKSVMGVTFGDVCKLMLYVDGTVCKDFRIERKRPPTTMWTLEFLRHRKLAEIKSGGLGKGELAGPFVKEEWDPMPKNLEGFIWKLNNYVDCIKIERGGFDKTLDAAKLLFQGNIKVTDLEERYIQSLRNQREDNKRTTDLEVPSFSLGLTQEEEMETRLNALEYAMGPETQEKVITTSEKVLQDVIQDISVVTRASAYMEETRGIAGHAALEATPLNYVRIVNADKDENSDEKRLAVYLFSKMDENAIDILFETKYGQKFSRVQIESLGPQESVENYVVSSWPAYLNFMEGKKNKYSPARLFFPTIKVDTKVFKCENAQTMEKFLEYVENVHSTYGGQSKLDEADINPTVSVIDSKKEVTKVATRAKKKVEDIDDIRVASILHKKFSEYLLAINHGNAAEIIEAQLVRGTFDWQTDKRKKAEYAVGAFEKQVCGKAITFRSQHT
ncbi:hypothetical protein Tco_0963349, partial [Tanacetum coccineum]